MAQQQEVHKEDDQGVIDSKQHIQTKVDPVEQTAGLVMLKQSWELHQDRHNVTRMQEKASQKKKVETHNTHTQHNAKKRTTRQTYAIDQVLVTVALKDARDERWQARKYDIKGSNHPFIIQRLAGERTEDSKPHLRSEVKGKKNTIA